MSFTLNRRRSLAPLTAVSGGIAKAATGYSPRAVLAALLLTALAPASASAAVGAQSSSKTSTVQILAPVDAAGQSQTIPAGLRIALNDGWKTYWRSPGAVSRAAGPAALIALATAVAIPAVLDRAAPAAASAASAQWRRFEPAEIGKLVAQGQTVFVDVTADWCVTCIVNKKLVIDRELVVGTLSRDGVVAMRADMTSPDPAIMAYLAQNGRYGIPFNMVYGPGAPRGLMLPELLSEGAVLDAIRKARTAG